MKLIRMHIDRFGGLDDFDYQFDSGLNLILEENGWGKTTMAAFIKAMFYGLESRRQKTQSYSERARFAPWSGGKFGGSLDFEAGGRRLRILRQFGTVPKADRTEIIDLDSGKPAGIDPDHIGESLFGLDAAAFSRSVFIGQNGFSLGNAASSIHARMDQAIDTGTDVSVFDAAAADLKKTIRDYEKQGRTGEIGNLNREIQTEEERRLRMKKDIDAQESSLDRIREIDEKLKELEPAYKDCQHKLEQMAREAGKHQAVLGMLIDLNEKLEKAQEKLEILRQEFGGSLPDQALLKKARLYREKNAVLNGKIEANKEETARLQNQALRIESGYHPSVPDEKTLQSLSQTARRVEDLQQDLADLEKNAQDPAALKTALQDAEKRAELLREILQLEDAYNAEKKSLQEITEQITRQNENEQAAKMDALEQKRRALMGQLETEKAYAPSVAGPVLQEITRLRKPDEKEASRLSDALDRIDQQIAAKEAEEQAALQQAAALKQKHPAAAARSEQEQEAAYELIDQLDQAASDLQQTRTRLRQLEEQPKLEMPDEKTSSEAEALLDQAQQAEKEYEKTAALHQQSQSRLEQAEAKLRSVPEETDLTEEQNVKNPGLIWLAAGILAAAAGLFFMQISQAVMLVLLVIGVVLIGFALIQKKKAGSRMQEEMQQRKEQSSLRKSLTLEVEKTSKEAAQYEQQADELKKQADQKKSQAARMLQPWFEQPVTSVQEARQAKEDRLAACRQQVQSLKEQKEQMESLQKKTAGLRQEIQQMLPGLDGFTQSAVRIYLRREQEQINKQNQQLQQASEQVQTIRREIDGLKTERRLEADRQKQDVQSQLNAYRKQYPELQSDAVQTASQFEQALAGRIKAYESLHASLQETEQQIDTLRKNNQQQAAERSQRINTLEDKKQTLTEQLEAKTDRIRKAAQTLQYPQDLQSGEQLFRKVQIDLERVQARMQQLNQEREKRSRIWDELQNARRQLQKKYAQIGNPHADQSGSSRLDAVLKDCTELASLKEKLAGLKEEKEALEQQSRTSLQLPSGYESKADLWFKAMPDQEFKELEEKGKQAIALEQETERIQADKRRLDPDGEIENSGLEEKKREMQKQADELEQRIVLLREEAARKSSYVRQINHTIDRYPGIVRKIRTLKKQKARTEQTIETMKTTLRLLEKAKENTAGRYLGKMENRFNAYLQKWLDDPQIQGVLDMDFNVRIEENGKQHEAERYSTGYSDLMDFCMRLALADTIFEKEKPFLVLDDPFTNLDARRLAQAMELLKAASKDEQMIYFTCHPLRIPYDSTVDEETFSKQD